MRHTDAGDVTAYGPNHPAVREGAGRAGRGEAPSDLVSVAARLGLEAVDILRLRGSAGPVLHDRGCDTLGFLVPAGTSAGWEQVGSVCTPTWPRRRGASCVGEEPPVVGTSWLVPPEGTRLRVTEPRELRAALGEALRTLEAAARQV